MREACLQKVGCIVADDFVRGLGLCKGSRHSLEKPGDSSLRSASNCENFLVAKQVISSL